MVVRQGEQEEVAEVWRRSLKTVLTKPRKMNEDHNYAHLHPRSAANKRDADGVPVKEKVIQATVCVLRFHGLSNQ